jgi:hypothetical protein
MHNKGFIISTDAFIGLSMLAFIVVISFFYLSTITLTSWNTIDLINTTRDEVTVLEKQQVLENAIKQSSADLILSKLNATPDSQCFELSIFSENNLDIPILYTLKTGCTKNYTHLVVADRTVVVNTDTNVEFYIAKLGGWYK